MITLLAAYSLLSLVGPVSFPQRSWAWPFEAFTHPSGIVHVSMPMSLPGVHPPVIRAVVTAVRPGEPHLLGLDPEAQASRLCLPSRLSRVAPLGFVPSRVRSRRPAAPSGACPLLCLARRKRHAPTPAGTSEYPSTCVWNGIHHRGDALPLDPYRVFAPARS